MVKEVNGPDYVLWIIHGASNGDVVLVWWLEDFLVFKACFESWIRAGETGGCFKNNL